MPVKRDVEIKTLTTKIDADLFRKFEVYCNEVGQTKRVALERILSKYLKDYYSQDEDTRRPL